MRTIKFSDFEDEFLDSEEIDIDSLEDDSGEEDFLDDFLDTNEETSFRRGGLSDGRNEVSCKRP